MRGSIVLMVEIFGPIVDHGHDVGIVVLVVIIEGVEKHTQAYPLVAGTKHWTFQTLND